MELSFSAEKKQRVIVNTDAKYEADDQYAIVHAILTPSFELHGIIPAHFGTRNPRFPDSLQASHDEVDLLLRLMDLDGKVRVEQGRGPRYAGRADTCRLARRAPHHRGGAERRRPPAERPVFTGR